jgi:hypothetical protein
MKKMIALLYAAIFALGILTGCSGTGNGTSNTTNSGGTSQTDTKSTLLSTTYADIMKSGKYFMHFTTATTVEGKTINSDTKMAVDGSSMSMISSTDGMNTHMIVKDKTVYVLNDDQKSYYKVAISSSGTGTTSSVEDEKINTAGMVYSSKGQAELNGKMLDYEEYKTDYGTIRYYFDGGKLYAIVFKSEKAETTMLIQELSSNVTADMFEIPSDYKEAAAY